MSEKSDYQIFVADVKDVLLRHLRSKFKSYSHSTREIEQVTDEIMRGLEETFKHHGVDWKLEEKAAFKV